MNIPSTLAVADSITWTDNPTSDNLGNDISAPTWTLNYAIRGSTVLDLVGSTNGNGWLTSISAAASGAMTAGIYYWQAYATNGSARVTLGTGQIKITPNLNAAVAGYDGRSQLKIDLDSLEAAIRAMITGGAVAEYSIGGRSLRKLPINELLVLRDKLKSEIRNEEAALAIASGLGSPKNVKVRFT